MNIEKLKELDVEVAGPGPLPDPPMPEPTPTPAPEPNWIESRLIPVNNKTCNLNNYIGKQL